PIDDAQLSLIPAPHARLIPQEGFVPAETPDGSSAVDSLTGRLPAEGSAWAVSLWTMDSRTERALLVGLILLVLAGVAHWGLRLDLGEWLNAHYAVALAALGLLWWLCFKASALGFLIL